MADDPGDRTEQPTPQRLQKARKQGQVGKSADLSAVILLVASAILVAAGGGAALILMGTVLQGILDGSAPGDAITAEGLVRTIRWIAARAAVIIVPTLAIMFAISLAGQIVQVGWVISFEAMAPKFERLNPIQGAKRILGKKGAVKLAVDIAKLVVVVAIATTVIMSWLPAICTTPRMDMMPAMGVALRSMAELMAWMLAVLLVIAIIDFRYQKWQHREDNKMTKQEVKEERKSMEGDPDIRQRRARIAREIALQRVQADVPGADVVIANPTHFSVAIRYDADAGDAPRVVAKGADWLALRIREIARLHGVPVVERPPLARALYRGVEVGRQISPEHYEAVAEVLAYVYRISDRARERAEAMAEAAN
ncbi:MAG: flagellar biosynthesis protein FlhB [Planctomycetota bacterium]